MVLVGQAEPGGVARSPAVLHSLLLSNNPVTRRSHAITHWANVITYKADLSEIFEDLKDSSSYQNLHMGCTIA